MSESLNFNVATTDGKEFTVTAVFADLIKYDVLRNRLGFPGREGNEFLFMGLITFCALLRTGQIPTESKPEQFLETIASIEPVVEDEAEFPAKSDN
jgi:hypothetical protein